MRSQLDHEKKKSDSIEGHLKSVLAESVADQRQKKHNSKRLVSINLLIALSGL